jgi:predicted dehydrogenase
MTIASSNRAVHVEAKGQKTLRAGVVGVGRMGRHHARVYASQIPGCQLVGVVDADPDRAESFAEQYGCKGLASVEALLKLGVDVVSIAVPTTYHLPMAAPLLEQGVACLIEKPLAGDVSEAQKIKAAADKSGAILMVGHIERFNPIMRALKREQANGLPIIPRFMEISRVSPMTFRSVDVSVVMDMMIHDLDVIIDLMDGAEPDEVYASGVPVITEHEDICSARLVFRRPFGTCVANVTSSRLAFKTERITRITGENAYVKIDYGAKAGSIIRRLANEEQMRQVRDQLRTGEDLSSVKWHDLVQIEELKVDEGEPIVMEIQSFIDAVRTGKQPEIDAKAGLANVRTAERIIEAARKERGTQQIK